MSLYQSYVRPKPKFKLRNKHIPFNPVIATISYQLVSDNWASLPAAVAGCIHAASTLIDWILTTTIIRGVQTPYVTVRCRTVASRALSHGI